jgi:hypothetical protein
MFGSTIIDVAAGVIFGFLAISLFASALMESMNSIFGLRARTLKQGVQKLLNDPNFNGLAKQLYAHALINPLGPGKEAPDKYKPSYIEPKQFAQAFLEVTKLTETAPTVADLKAKIGKITDEQIRDFLLGVVDRASGDLEEMQQQIANWFDAAMDRLSGEFKRWNQLCTFAIALGAAVLFNLDSVRIARVLWTNPALVDNLQANAVDKAVLTDSDGVGSAVQLVNRMMEARLPAGWAPGHFFELSADANPSDCQPNDAACQAQAKGKTNWVYFYRAPISIVALSVLGWLVTATSALFGAPFWFDALQSIVQIRSAGPTPADKQKARAAAT